MLSVLTSSGCDPAGPQTAVVNTVKVIVKALSMGGIRQSITTAQLIALGERFNVKPWQAALDAERSDVT